MKERLEEASEITNYHHLRLVGYDQQNYQNL